MAEEEKRRPLFEALLSRIDGYEILAELAGERREKEREVREERRPDTFSGLLQGLVPLMILPQLLPLFQQALAQTLQATTVNVRVESATSIIPIDISATTAIVPIEIRASQVALNVNIASSTTLDINIVSQSIQVDINFGGQTIDVQTSGTFFVLGGMGKYFWSEGQIPGVPVFSAKWVQTFIDYTVPAGRRMFVESISFNLISRITLWMYDVYGTGATYAIEGVGDPQAEFYVYLGTAIIAKISLNGKKLSTTYVPSIPIRVDAGTRFSVIGIGSIYGVWATVTAIAYERPA